METTLTSLLEISDIDRYNFGGILLSAGLSDVNIMQSFYGLTLESATIGDVAYFNGLYSQWLTLGSPIVDSSNWQQFVDYFLAHPYVQGN